VNLDVDKIRSLDVADREVLLWHELSIPDAFNLAKSPLLIPVVKTLLTEYLAMVELYTTCNTSQARIVAGRQPVTVCQRKPVRHSSILFDVTSVYCYQCTI
jgi:hypothetical protein